MKRIWIIFAGLCLFMHISAQDTVKKKDPGLAWFMSFFIPGAGQFYNGQYVKGGIMMGFWTGLINKRNRLSIKPDLSMRTQSPFSYQGLAPVYDAKLSLTF